MAGEVGERQPVELLLDGAPQGEPGLLDHPGEDPGRHERREGRPKVEREDGEDDLAEQREVDALPGDEVDRGHEVGEPGLP